MTDINPAVETVVNRCLAVHPGEIVLVVADPDRVDVGRALHEGAVRAGGDSVFVLLPPRPERGTEPPPTVAAAFAACDVYLAPCLPSLSHTRARNAATERGARGATLPGVEADMFARLMGADFDAMVARSRAVAELLTAADEARFTCPRGSDMRFDLRSRTGIADDGDLTATGAFGNLPCGEGFISPAGGSGVLVASTVGHFGAADHEVRLTVEDGRLTGVSGELGDELLAHLTRYGEDGRHLAELGVGTNDQARLGGNLLEDEKVLGTVHVAFGASAAIGGTVNVPVHEDSVVEAGRFLL
ncbi:MAG TPA: aminopeptidase [Solirubrobacteraceae bacterium]|nr:aminopeptidase [Solirubrobacteraceae bacterium]